MALSLILIAAVARNRVIGRAGRMPWHLPGDMAHFRRATMGKPVLMGRKTYDSIGHPLEGRPTIVLSRDAAFEVPGATVVRTIASALAVAQAQAAAVHADRIMVAGGAELYHALLCQAQTLLITDVETCPAGDAVFPPIDPEVWDEVSRVAGVTQPGDAAPYAFVRYERRLLSHLSNEI